MLSYRVYRLDKSGKIASFPLEVEAASDEHALRLSSVAFPGEAFEVWRGSS